MFTWYWIADLCNDHEIPFVLGHALYMKAIHGGKAKNDKIDSRKIAVLLRGDMIPVNLSCQNESNQRPAKGSRKNNFTELALRFRLGPESRKLVYLVDFKEQKA